MTQLKNQPPRNLAVFGVAGAYVAGMLMTALIGFMVAAPFPANKGSIAYNRSGAFYDEQAEKLLAQGASLQDQVGENLLYNGSFEEPPVTSGGRLVPGGGVFGWEVAWTTPTSPKVTRQTRQPVVELMAGNSIWTAQQGNQFARLDIETHSIRMPDTRTLVTLSQNVKASSGVHELSFWYAAEPGTPDADNQLEVWWNDNLIDTIEANGLKDTIPQWHRYSYVLQGNDEVNQLQFVAKGKENRHGNLLDNINLTPKESAAVNYRE